MAAAQPTPPFDVKAIAAYTARNNTEVSLEVGRVYKVLQTDGRGLWWQTRTEDGTGVGWFPASYTEVVATPPPVHAQPAAAPPSHVQAVTQQTSSTSFSTPTLVANTTGSSSDIRPQPSKQSVEKGPTYPCYVTVHIVKAKDLVGAKLSPIAFVYKREVMVDGKNAKPIFFTPERKKTNAPDWNEEFKLFIKDAELEVVCVRVCNGKSNFKTKILGELEFPLRGAVRKFDKPNGEFKWFPLKGGKEGKEKVGEMLLFIEFVDTRATEGPKNVKHEGHVGISSTGGFEIRDIPAEWKQLFRVLNIKKKDLEQNPEMAKEVFKIMNDAAEAVNAGVGAVTHTPAGGHSNYTAPEQTHTHTQTYTAPTPAPTPAVHAPPPPPAPTATRSPPPPPPPGGASKPAPAPTPAPTPVVVAPPPAPTPTLQPSSGNSILDQIKAGGIKLKKAEIAEVEKGTASTGNALADTLINAMSKYRVDIAGNDKADEDDWSE